MNIFDYIELLVLIVIFAFAAGYWYGHDQEEPPKGAGDHPEPWDVK